jgi:DNA repair ATPase RecN
MKTNIERVYSKLPQKKHNFKNHKIKLSLVDEINAAINLIEPLMKDGEDYNAKLRDLGKRIEEIADEANTEVSMASAFLGLGYNATEQVDEVLENVRVKADEIGVDPSVIDGYTKLEELAKIDFFAIKGIEDAYFEEVHYNADRLKTIVDAQW